MPVMSEYKENYKKGDYGAKKAYDMLNKYREDDSDKLLGDFFLSDPDEVAIVKVLVEGNQYSIAAATKALAFAVECETDLGSRWTERLTKVTSYNAVVKQYAKQMYGTANVLGEEKQKVEQAIRSDLDETANKILANWGEFRKLMLEADESLKELEEEDVNSDITPNEYAEAAEDMKTVSTAEYAKTVNYGKKTMNDLFRVSADTLKKDITRLYPLVYALSPGQRSILKMIDPTDLVQADIVRNVDEKNDTEALKEADTLANDIIDSVETISLYEGVDRAMFADGAAMTSAATANMSGGYVDPERENMEKVYKIGFAAGLLFIGMGSYLFFKSISMFEEEVANTVNGKVTSILGKYSNATNTLEIAEDFSNTEVLQLFGITMVLLGLFLAGYSVYKYIKMKKEESNVEQLPIPVTIVDFDTANEAGRYVTYHAVQWNRMRDDKEERGDRADLNGDAAREWLVLYTTTDKTMGEPILADSITAKTGDDGGRTTPGTDYVPLTMFGSQSVQNLVDERYCFNDKVGGIWMWYQKGTDATGETEDVIDDEQTAEEGTPEETPYVVSGS